MTDLFEREEQVLKRSQSFLDTLGEDDSACRKELTYLTGEYAQLLRQLRWVTRISDLTALGLNTDKTTLLNKVNVDALTEIYNRRFLMSNLEHFLVELTVSGEWITLMMLDVDFFKNYNDAYGHSVGDSCLRKVANALHNSLSGADDFVVRYGGEEFIAVLPGADPQMGQAAAQRILDNIEALDIPHGHSEIASHVTISIGLVSAIPSARGGMQLYIDRADAALYQSKAQGRNRMTILPLEEDLP